MDRFGVMRTHAFAKVSYVVSKYALFDVKHLLVKIASYPAHRTSNIVRFLESSSLFKLAVRISARTLNVAPTLKSSSFTMTSLPFDSYPTREISPFKTQISTSKQATNTITNHQTQSPTLQLNHTRNHLQPHYNHTSCPETATSETQVSTRPRTSARPRHLRRTTQTASRRDRRTLISHKILVSRPHHTRG